MRTVTMTRDLRPVLLLAVASLAVGAMVPAPATSAVTLDVAWWELQQEGAWFGGTANLDGVAGDEILVGGHRGGVYAARGDGTVLWRHASPAPNYEAKATGGGIPTLMDDVTGDGRSDVLATFGGETTGDGEAVVLSGADGAVLWRTPIRPRTVSRALAGDLDRDGDTDLLVPQLAEGVITLLAFDGPDFAPAWSASLPAGEYLDPDGLHIGQLEGRTVVVAGSRRAGAVGGGLVVLDAGTGQTLRTVNTGPVLAAAAIDGRIVTYQWSLVGPQRRGAVVGYAATGGDPLWTVPLTSHIKMAPWLTADVDDDGVTEVVLATAFSQEGQPLTPVGPAAPSSSLVHAVGSDGRPRWVHKTGHDARALGLSPVAGGGADVVYGTDTFGGAQEHVGLISGATGRPVWLHDHGYRVARDAVEGVAVADFDGNGSAEVVYSSHEQQLTTLSLADGAVVARRAYPGRWMAAGAADLDGDGTVDVVGGGLDRTVRAVEDGETRWRTPEPLAGVVTGVHVQPGTVLAATVGSTLSAYAFNAGGTQQWQYTSDLTPLGALTVHRQTFADLNSDGVADVILGGRDPAQRPAVVAVDGRRGVQLWRAVAPQPTTGYTYPATLAAVIESVSVVRGDVVATIKGYTREDETATVLRIDGMTGAIRWSAAAALPSFGDAAAYRSGDNVLIAMNRGTVAAYRWTDGASGWEADLGKTHRFIAFGDGLLALDHSDSGEFSAKLIDAHGEVTPVDADSQPGAQAAAWVPGVGVLSWSHGGKGAVVLDEAELRSGRAVTRGVVGVPPHRAGTAETVDHLFSVPTATGHVVVGLSDAMLLSGDVGGARGVWVLHVGD